MDVSDLLSFKPETIPKRKQDDAAEAEGKPETIPKKPRIEEIDLGDDEGDEVLDEIGLKKLALIFEKRVLNNQKMRLKYPESPEKFMVSFFSFSCVTFVLKRFIDCRSRKLICTMPLNSFKQSQLFLTFIQSWLN